MKRPGKQSPTEKSPDQVARILQTYLDRGNAPKQSWMEFVYPVNNNGVPRWIIDKEALADRMWLKANDMGRVAHLEVA